jgi:hypothetical protein
MRAGRPLERHVDRQALVRRDHRAQTVEWDVSSSTPWLEDQISLFTADTEFLVYMDSRNAVPTQEIRGRDGLRPVFENLSTYEATTHVNGQSTVTWAG